MKNEARHLGLFFLFSGDGDGSTTVRPNLEPIVGDMVNVLWTSAAADAEVRDFGSDSTIQLAHFVRCLYKFDAIKAVIEEAGGCFSDSTVVARTHQVLPRKSTLIRRHGTAAKPQVLCANLDLALLVLSVEPNFSEASKFEQLVKMR